MRRRCTPQLPRSRRGVEAIKRGLPERPLFTAEVDYNQTVVHKTARLRYYCHLNGLAPARTRRRVLPRSRHRGCRGETWKLNARDRSVIIQDKGGERRGARGRGTISSDRTQIREKKLHLIVERWCRPAIGRIDHSRSWPITDPDPLCVYMCVALIITSSYYQLQTKDRLQIVAVWNAAEVNRWELNACARVRAVIMVKY